MNESTAGAGATAASAPGEGAKRPEELLAKDLMTTNVITVGPDTPVEEVAARMVEHHISGLPVVDGEGRLLGIISEGDLMHRRELGTDEDGRPRSWWLALLESPEEELQEFVRSHGRRARDVMTREVVTVHEDTPLPEIVRTLEAHRIKRVPVVRDGKVVGIISRANILQALARSRPERSMVDDAALRREIERLIREEGWMTHGVLNATVSDGRVEVWGWAESEAEREAIRTAIESIPGVRSVEMHVGVIAPYLRGT